MTEIANRLGSHRRRSALRQDGGKRLTCYRRNDTEFFIKVTQP
jgi:hypothetical protein